MSGGKPDITAPGPDGLQGIFWLINQHDRNGIAAWLDSGGEIEARGFLGASPAPAAAVADNWPTVLFLLERGARGDIADGQGFTLGYLATRSRVLPESRLGGALAKVRVILAERGVLSRIYQPAEVRRMKADGRWPPVGFR